MSVHCDFNGTIALMTISTITLDSHTRQQICETFVGTDLSIIEEVLYFDGWTSYEECGGYLIFKGIDGSIQRCDYGYCVMVEDNTNHFLPTEITHEEYLACVQEMESAAQSIDF